MASPVQAVVTFHKTVTIDGYGVPIGTVVNNPQSVFKYWGCNNDGPKSSIDSCAKPQPPKRLGTPAPGSCTGDPCDAGTGNEFQYDTDYQGASDTLSFSRAYNSLDIQDHGLGYGWVSNIGGHLAISGSLLTAYQAINGSSLTVYQADGKGLPFTLTNGVWQGDADSKLQLTQDATGYTLQRQDGSSDRYDLHGHLLSETDRAGRTTTYTYDSANHIAAVTGPFGHTLTFTYNSYGRLVSLTDPVGQVTSYSYDTAGNLAQVNYPDGTAKQYSYGDSSFSHALTGVAFVDANGNVTPFDNFVYDSYGKVTTNELSGGQQRFDLSYDSDTQTTVTNAAGRQDVLTFQAQLGVKNLLSNIVQGDGKGLTQQFDARNNVISRTNADGQTTQYTYDSQNRLASETQAAGTSQARTVSYQYGTDGLALPAEIDRPSVCAGSSQQTVITYDAHHNPIQITENGYTPACSAISRSLSLGYNSAGQVTRIDGPRTDVSDVTTMSYNNCTTGGACGQLLSLTDALGHITTFNAYDADGRLLQKTDPNGLVTSYAYDPRGRLSRITQQASGSSARVTTFAYTPSSKLASTSLPDGRTLTYSYDDAQELTAITDNLGDKVSYAYDSRGNRSQTSIYDPDSSLVRQIKSVYDLRNHLASSNDSGSITQQVTDALGNLVQQTDPNNNAPTTHSYDPLNRLIQTVNAIGGTTSYGYDVNAEINQVITPNGATTGYQNDDFGDLLQEVSPDRGTTTYAYDAAGNLIQKTDARGVIANYSYDALNRLTATHFSGMSQASDADITLTYDHGQNCSNGIGHLCTAQDQSGTTIYAYDAFGNILNQIHSAGTTTSTISYRYDNGNRIAMIIYPDGREVGYTRDAIGRVQGITTTAAGNSQTLVSARQYHADGSLTGETFGNGLADQRQYTAQGRLSSWTLGGSNVNLNYGYSYDANGNMTGQSGPDGAAAYQYDPLDRLIDESWGTGNYHNAFSYDNNGNRLTSLDSGGNTVDYSYDLQSNRLNQHGSQKITLDAAGNTTNDGTYQYLYDAAGRLSEVLLSGVTVASYRYDYRGLRREKIIAAGTTEFTYGPSGHLLSEQNTASGGRDYVWSDTSPIAQIDVNGSNQANDAIYYLHTDAMGTPRLATNANQQTVWRWNRDAFGDRQVNASSASIEMNLRYPGQYYDTETGLFYNWNRYYDPSTGRYATSDPIGLSGGVNTFGYVSANPLALIDPWGLFGSAQVSPIPPGYNSGDVRGAYDSYGNSSVYEPGYYDPNRAAAIIMALLAAGMGPAADEFAAILAHAEEASAIGGECEAAASSKLPSLDDLSRAASASDRNGFSKAGRSLQKHGSRPGSKWGQEDVNVNNPSEANSRAQGLVDDILNSPGTNVVQNSRGGVDVISQDGRVVRYNRDGSMQGFRE
ncbi:RHS repeat-associated core domain-containing protein [Halothiobacillus neapolitanus]|nr:RHS repeat-associated core domain-containing protein [Halothiobacillus neapolitanus]